MKLVHLPMIISADPLLSNEKKNKTIRLNLQVKNQVNQVNNKICVFVRKNREKKNQSLVQGVENHGFTQMATHI